MTARALASVAFRTWGVILLADVLPSMPIAVFNARLASRGSYGLPPGTGAYLVGGLVVNVLAAFVLILFADSLARWSVGDDASVPLPPLDAKSLALTAFGCVGVFMLVGGARTLAGATWALMAYGRRLPQGLQLIADRQRESIARSSVLVVAGLLIIWRGRIAAAFSHLSDASQPPFHD